MKKIKLITLSILIPLLSHSQSGFLEDIINAVNQDSLVTTLEELTGEKTFQLSDSNRLMPNRDFNSPEHSIVQQYLIEKFQKLGYSVETEGFTYGSVTDICFSPDDSLKGWCVSSNYAILATLNGGENWFLETSLNANFKSVVALNDSAVIAISHTGIYKRRDSACWEEIDMGTKDHSNFNNCFFLNEHTGWVYGYRSLLKTTDGGESWNTMSDQQDVEYTDVFFVDENKGWLLKSNMIYASVDGGENWIRQDSLQEFPALRSICFLDTLNGLMLSADGIVYRSEDGGETWSEQNTFSGDHFMDISFLDSEHGIITDPHTLYITHDGGYTWAGSKLIFSNKQYLISSATMTDTSVVYVAGDVDLIFPAKGFLIACTEDGGTTWSNLNQNIRYSPNMNIIATKTGSLLPDEYYILSAHYDDKPTTPGADDNGSGVAAVFEAARILSKYDFDYSIKYILFDAEEIGLIGSAVFTDNIHNTGLENQIKGVINLDMIGYDGLPDGVFNIYSNNDPVSRAIANRISSKADSFNLDLSPNHFANSDFGASDHASFWQIQVPAVLVLESYDQLNPDYHGAGDVIENMDLDYYTSIVRASIAALAELASDTGSILLNGISDLYGYRVPKPYPNPAKSFINIPVSVQKDMEYTIKIYDLFGRSIATVYSGYLFRGEYIFKWVLDDTDDKNALKGIYLIQYNSDLGTFIHKILVK